LPEVLDALAEQVRPPDRVVVVVDDAASAALAAVREQLLSHDRLREVVPDATVLPVQGGPGPLRTTSAGQGPVPVGLAVDAVLAELDRTSVPNATGGWSTSQPSTSQPSTSAESTGSESTGAESSSAVSSGTVSEGASGGADPSGAESTDEASGTAEPTRGEPIGSRAATPPLGPTYQRGRQWLWILDDATAPAPATLLRLVDTVRRSQSVGIAGPKVVEWDQPRQLVELGRQVTRAGRRIDSPEPGEADQGQYDTRSDVLAVGITGMLVSRSVLDDVAGFDRAFPAHGADLDLGWRAQLAGHRVVVVPTAVVRHADGGMSARSAASTGSSSTGATIATTRLTERRAERRASRRVALTRCSLVAAPFLAVWILLSSLVGATALLLLKRPQHAWSELGDLAALVRPVSSIGARFRFRRASRSTRSLRASRVRRRDLRSLFVGGGTAVGHTWDRVQEAFTPDRVSGPTEPAPASEQATETGPVSEEAEALTGLPPSLPQRIATHPGFLATLACLVLSAVMFRSALAQGVLNAQGAGLSGGELHALATDSGGLWHQFRDGWHGAGWGNALDVSPAVGVLAALTWLVERLPYVDSGRSPASVTLAWLLIAAMPLSAVTAYLAGRVATRSRWGRGLVALAWGSSGVLLAAISAGRVSLVIAHILLPLVVAGFGATLGRGGTWTLTFATALVTGVIGAFVPALLVVAVAAALVAVLVGPGVGRRVRALVLLVVPTTLLGPWVMRFVEEPRLLLSGPGLVDVGTDSPPAWQLALAQPDGGRRLLGFLFVPLLVVAVLALVRRSGGRPRTVSMVGLSALALIGLAVALGSERVEVGQAAGDDGVSTLATLWTGVGLELWVIAVLGIVLTGWHGLAHVLGEPRWGWRRVAAGLAAAVVTLTVAAAGGLLAWQGSGPLAPGSTVLPAVAVDQASGPDANRLVVLRPATNRLDYTLYGNEPGDLMRDVTRATQVTDPGLAPVLGSIASGSDTLASGAGPALADLGVGFVSLRGAGDSALARTLDAAPGLTRLGASEDQTLWRVLARPSSVAVDVPVPPARVRLDDDAARPLQSVPVVGPHGAVSRDLSVGAPGRRVVLAEAPEWAGHA
ncbi:MAG: glycosyltransferase, partial [Actinomycetota bacterium]|nr:glycosyltransferase [Actinomycetota bacterium]